MGLQAEPAGQCVTGQSPVTRLRTDTRNGALTGYALLSMLCLVFLERRRIVGGSVFFSGNFFSGTQFLSVAQDFERRGSAGGACEAVRYGAEPRNE